MTRIRLTLVGCFVVVFAAGVSTGLLLPRLKDHSPRRSWLASQLKLTPQQEEQMRTIWEGAVRTPGGREGWSALARERDDAVEALLSEEQRAKYDAILQEHVRRLEELSQQRKRSFDEAVERTKSILTPDQAEKYDALLKRRDGKGGPPGPGPRQGRPRHPPPAGIEPGDPQEKPHAPRSEE